MSIQTTSEIISRKVRERGREKKKRGGGMVRQRDGKSDRSGIEEKGSFSVSLIFAMEKGMQQNANTE